MIDQEILEVVVLIIAAAVKLFSRYRRRERHPSPDQEAIERRTSMISEQLTISGDGRPGTITRTTRIEVITRVSVGEPGWIDDRRGR